MGSGGQVGAGHAPRRRKPRLQLQRLRPGHRRTRRTGPHHPLRV
nr:hypothetical protein [Pseudomonas sp. B35(2017)]